MIRTAIARRPRPTSHGGCRASLLHRLSASPSGERDTSAVLMLPRSADRQEPEIPVAPATSVSGPRTCRLTPRQHAFDSRRRNLGGSERNRPERHRAYQHRKLVASGHLGGRTQKRLSPVVQVWSVRPSSRRLLRLTILGLAWHHRRLPNSVGINTSSEF